MNKEEPYRDQAERLKRRIERLNEQTEIVVDDQLPPREQLHRQKKKKTKIKLKYPVIRLLVLFFILLPIIYFSVVSYLHTKDVKPATKSSGDSIFEKINLEKSKEENKTNTNAKETPKDDQTEDSSKQNTEPDSSLADSEKTQTEEQSSKSSQDTSKSQPEADNSSTKTTAVQNSSTNTNASQQNSTAAKIIYHRVKAKETLFHIAMTYYHSSSGIEIIKQANHLRSETVYAGQVLKIPLR